MAKYEAEFKYEVIQAYFSGEGGLESLAKRFGIKAHANIEIWIKQYQTYGFSGLEKRREKQKYTMQFKLDVLRYYYQSGLSTVDVAIKFNIPSPGTLSNWKYKFNSLGIDGLKPKQRGRSPMSKKTKKQTTKKLTREQELEHENELLRAELAFIKKLQALGLPIPKRLKNENPESSTRFDKNLN